MAYTPGLFEPNKYKPSLMDEVQEELFKEDARKRRQDQWRDNFNKGPVPEADEPALRDEESRESNEIVQADPVMDVIRIAGMNLPGIDVDKDLDPVARAPLPGMMKLGGPVESQKTAAELWNGIESQYEEQSVQEEPGSVEQTSQVVDTKPWTQKGVPGFFTRGRAVTETFEAISKAASEGKTHEEQALAFEQGFILPMIQGVWEGVKKYMSTAPTNPETGEVRPESVDAAFENALNFVAPGYARALGAPKGSVELGMVGGRGATGFRKARQEGRTYVGAEGAEKFEFSDKGLEWNISLGKDDPLSKKLAEEGVPLWDAIVHPELKKQYPTQFDHVVVKTDPKFRKGRDAEFDGGVITMSPEDIGTPRGKKMIAHELQHNVQRVEKFASGGSPDDFMAMNTVFENLLTGPPSVLTPESLKSYPMMIKNWKAVEASLIDAFNDVLWQGQPGRAVDLPSINNFMRTHKDRIDRQRFVSPEDGSEISFVEAVQERARLGLYNRLGGETESFNVDRRQDWTTQERMEKPFKSTEKYPRSQQIIDPTNLHSGKMLSKEPPKLEAIEGGIPKMEEMLDELNDDLVKALKEGGTVDMSKVDDINFLAKELEKAHKKGEGRRLRLAAKEGEALPETVVDDAATKAAKDLFEGKTTIKELPNRFSDEELREQIQVINKRLHNEADTLTDAQKKALVEYRGSIINKVKNWQIDTPELDARIAAEWDKMVEDAKRPRIIEGGKVMKEYLDEMAQRSLDDANRSAHPLSRNYIEDADLVRHKRMLYDRYKDAGRWHDRIVMVAKQMKDSGVDLASKHIKGMQDLIVQRLHEASDLKRIIDTWEYQKSLGLPGPDIATRNKMTPANQPQQRLDKDPVISKDPNQLELDLKPPTSEATRGRAPFLREVKKLVEDDSEITKAIEKVTGKKWTDVSRKDWENKLSHEEKHKVFNELVSKDTGGRKDLSAARTPEELINYDEPFRPKDIPDKYKAKEYVIIDGQTKEVVGAADSLKAASRAAERRNLQYGGHRYYKMKTRWYTNPEEGPKGVGAARTPEELINYDEPNRPSDKMKAKMGRPRAYQPTEKDWADIERMREEGLTKNQIRAKINSTLGEGDRPLTDSSFDNLLKERGLTKERHVGKDLSPELKDKLDIAFTESSTVSPIHDARVEGVIWEAHLAGHGPYNIERALNELGYEIQAHKIRQKIKELQKRQGR